MPELPEVETVKETLKRQILGKRIDKVDVRCERIVRGIPVSEFTHDLSGHVILDITRQGKYIFFHCDGIVMVVHLRMEGKFFLKPDTDPYEKHEHVIFVFSDHTTLRYHDVRKFGTMELMSPGTEQLAKGVDKLGLEPFATGFGKDYLKPLVQKSKRPIKSILLDQTVVAGLGNIYVDEVLFRAKLDPKRPGTSISDHDLEQIAVFSKQVLAKAIELGGSTIRSYVSSLGVTGRFQNELKVHTMVGKPCPVCGTVIEKTKVGGRGTYYCPHCQK